MTEEHTVTGTFPESLRGAPALAWSFFDRLNRGDVTGAFALMTEDGTFWNNSGRTAIPRDVMTPLIARILDHVPLQMRLHTAMSDGDRVVLECESEGLTRDKVRYNNVYAFVVEIVDERIVAIREYADTLHGQDVLGNVSS